MFQRAHAGPNVAVPSVLDDADAITFYVMGPIGDSRATGNWYTTLPNWPTYQPRSYYLSGTGGLQSTIPSASTRAYNYNPNDPAEHYGGHNLGGTCGPLVQNEIEARSDVISFTSNTFTADTAFVGLIQVVLFVSSDRNDTDFIVKVNDVHPNGESHLLSEGAIRMRLRESGYYYTPMNPGQIYEVTIDVWETSFVFNVGHQLRLTVMSSSWDRWGINNNNFSPLDTPLTRLTARNTVYVGSTHPSRVIMPFVEFSQIPPAEIDFLMDL
jgi:putative CocE/NonD family hydrolase